MTAWKTRKIVSESLFFPFLSPSVETGRRWRQEAGEEWVNESDVQHASQKRVKRASSQVNDTMREVNFLLSSRPDYDVEKGRRFEGGGKEKNIENQDIWTEKKVILEKFIQKRWKKCVCVCHRWDYEKGSGDGDAWAGIRFYTKGRRWREGHEVLTAFRFQHQWIHGSAHLQQTFPFIPLLSFPSNPSQTVCVRLTAQHTHRRNESYRLGVKTKFLSPAISHKQVSRAMLKCVKQHKWPVDVRLYFPFASSRKTISWHLSSTTSHLVQRLLLLCLLSVCLFVWTEWTPTEILLQRRKAMM